MTSIVVTSVAKSETTLNEATPKEFSQKNIAIHKTTLKTNSNGKRKTQKQKSFLASRKLQLQLARFEEGRGREIIIVTENASALRDDADGTVCGVVVMTQQLS